MLSGCSSEALSSAPARRSDKRRMKDLKGGAARVREGKKKNAALLREVAGSQAGAAALGWKRRGLGKTPRLWCFGGQPRGVGALLLPPQSALRVCNRSPLAPKAMGGVIQMPPALLRPPKGQPPRGAGWH